MTTDSEPLKLQINGAPQTVRGPMTVHELLADLGVDPRQVAVERNRQIVSKSDYLDTRLCDGDQLEIVTFVGGG